MTKATDATMRRIAIVLASLPEPVAQRLLGALPRDNQRLVRAALGTLSEVDPLEQRRALDGFAHSLRKDKTASPKQSDAAEIVFSRAALRNLNDRVDDLHSIDSSQPMGQHESPSASYAPLGFLLDVDDETLVTHLKGEMPQTLAIILASISPSQAARVLPRLDPSVRADAMRRISNLKELPAELIDDIGSQLRDRFSSHGSSGTGRRALEAILAEMSQAPATPSTQQTTYASMAQQTVTSQQTPSSPQALGARGDDRMPSRSPAGAPNSPLQNNQNPHSTEAFERESSSHLKVAEGTWPDANTSRKREAAPGAETVSLRTASPLDSTDSIHAYLLSLPIDRLREALGRSETRQAMLALCGLPSAKAEALLSSLPRKQAKQVREQLASLGTLQLRDIDEAKSAVAAIAYGAGGQLRVNNATESRNSTTSSPTRQANSPATAAAA